MQIYDPAAGGFITEGKEYGKKMQPDEVHGALGRFFLRPRVVHGHHGASQHRVVAIDDAGATEAERQLALNIGLRRLDRFIDRLERLAAWFAGALRGQT